MLKGYSQALVLIGTWVILATTGGCNRSAAPENPGTSAAPSAPLDSKDDRGIGPVSTLQLSAVNPAVAGQGKLLFAAKCASCHKIEEKYVGPALRGVTGRRRPEWILNMILNPAEMTQKDPVAKDLLATYLTSMSFQNVTEPEARKILEFFRQNDATP